jgi:hypothetical protein
VRLEITMMGRNWHFSPHEVYIYTPFYNTCNTSRKKGDTSSRNVLHRILCSSLSDVHYSPCTEYMLEGWPFLTDFLTLGFILNPSESLDWWHFYHLLHVKHMMEGLITIQPYLQQLPVIQEVRSPTMQAPAPPMEEWQWVAGGGAYSLTWTLSHHGSSIS